MSHYDVLGLSPSATEAQIRNRYRELVKVVHPDAGGDPYQFQILTEAFTVLSDPATRVHYDAEAVTRAESGPAERAHPAGAPEANAGGAGRWLVDGCATEIAGWVLIIPFFFLLWLLAKISGRGVGEVQTAGVVVFAVVAVGVMSLRYLRGGTR